LRQDEEFFDGRELLLVYIAKRLREAQRLEALFDEAGLDYLVEADTYRGGVLFVRELTGAFFYVAEGDKERAAGVLLANKLRPYEPVE
jgi:hypothetical protein